MKTESKYFAQIPDYLDELLSQEDQEVFEQQLKTNEGLVREVDLHREVLTSLENNDQRRFREKLEKFNRKTPVNDRESKKKSTFISLKTFIGIAASILLLIALGTWFFQPGPSAREQFTAYLEHYDPADILPPSYTGPDRGAQSDPDATPSELHKEAPLHEARQLFSQKQYSEALAAMKAIDPDRLPDSNAYWYELGILYLLNDQPQETIDALEKINASALENTKRWHLALAYVQLNRLDDARSMLLPLLERSNPWQEKARALNRTL